MKKDLNEFFQAMYTAESDMALNLFCVSLISSDSLWDTEDCMYAKDKVMQFERFLSGQKESEKKTHFLEFCEKAHKIIDREYEAFYKMEEEEKTLEEEKIKETGKHLIEKHKEALQVLAKDD